MKIREVLEKHQKEMERIGAEEKSLGDLESSYRTILKSAEDARRANDTFGNRLKASFSRDYADKLKKKNMEQESIINEMNRELQQIEKRRNEIDRIRQKKESDRAQAEANARKVLMGIVKERTEVRRQQQRELEMQEKEERTRTDFGVSRLMKRGKRR